MNRAGLSRPEAQVKLTSEPVGRVDSCPGVRQWHVVKHTASHSSFQLLCKANVGFLCRPLHSCPL